MEYSEKDNYMTAKINDYELHVNMDTSTSIPLNERSNLKNI